MRECVRPAPIFARAVPGYPLPRTDPPSESLAPARLRSWTRSVATILWRTQLAYRASRAGSGKFKKRLEQLNVLDVVHRYGAPVHFRKAQEEVPIAAFLVADGRLRRHIDCLLLGFTLAFRRADFHAQPATGTIFRSNLQHVAHMRALFPASHRGAEAIRRSGEQGRLGHLSANHRVRAYHHALAALYANVLLPNRDFLRQVSLLPLRFSGGVGAVDRHCAYRQAIAGARHDGPKDVPNKFGRLVRYSRGQIEGAGRRFRNPHFRQVRQRIIHRGKVLLNHRLASLAVGLLDGMFDGRDGVFSRRSEERRVGKESRSRWSP